MRPKEHTRYVFIGAQQESDSEAPLARGGSPIATMMSLSTAQLRDKYLATGLAAKEDIDRYRVFARDPDSAAVYHRTIRVIGLQSSKWIALVQAYSRRAMISRNNGVVTKEHGSAWASANS